MEKIVFVITGLGGGGAEMMLFKLLSRIDRTHLSPHVVSLTSLDTLAPKFKGIEVPVTFLNMGQGIPDPRGLLRLIGFLRRERPALVQTWMYHADLLGGLAAKGAGRFPVLWNIRNGTLEQGAAKKSTLLTVKACAHLSRHLPERIVCCAESARRIHVKFGYEPSRFTVIPNGFDTALFRPAPESRLAVRKELGWQDDVQIVGLLARFHPQKDHETFFQAAGVLSRAMPTVRFLLSGEGITEDNPILRELIAREALRGKVRLLGHRSDVPRVTAALDVAVSSSYSGEAFSNALGEAMACGVPCVATNVGDAALILGETGRVVPPREPRTLAAAIEKILRMPEQVRGEASEQSRKRVEAKFSLDAITSRYEDLYAEILERNQSCRRRADASFQRH